MRAGVAEGVVLLVVDAFGANERALLMGLRRWEGGRLCSSVGRVGLCGANKERGCLAGEHCGGDGDVVEVEVGCSETFVRCRGCRTQFVVFPSAVKRDCLVN